MPCDALCVLSTNYAVRLTAAVSLGNDGHFLCVQKKKKNLSEGMYCNGVLAECRCLSMELTVCKKKHK